MDVASPGDKWDAEFNFKYIQYDVGHQMNCVYRFALVCDTLKRLRIGPISIIRCTEWLPNLKIFLKVLFPVSKSCQLRFSCQWDLTLPCLLLPLGWFCFVHCSGIGSPPLKTLYLPYWFALRNTQPHTVGPFFNPLMQNKVCVCVKVSPCDASVWHTVFIYHTRSKNGAVDCRVRIFYTFLFTFDRFIKILMKHFIKSLIY